MPDLERRRLVAHPITPSTEKGGGCLVMFALPFIGVGIFVVLLSLGYLPMGHSRSKDAPPWLLSVFGSVFAFAGLGLASAGIAGMWRARAARVRKEAHPMEPWYWDHPWDSRWSEAGGIGPAIQGFLMSAFLSAFLSMFNWWAFFSDEGPLPVKIFVALFDLMPLIVLLGAFYSLFQYLKYGKSRLYFARFPFRPGNSIEAGLVAGRRIAKAPSLLLTLRYIEQVAETTGTGKNRSTTQVLYCLHEIKQELSANQYDASSDTGIPINIRLPAGDYANRLLGTPRRYWELEVKAETPGIDYAARFLLPVY